MSTRERSQSRWLLRPTGTLGPCGGRASIPTTRAAGRRRSSPRAAGAFRVTRRWYCAPRFEVVHNRGTLSPDLLIFCREALELEGNRMKSMEGATESMTVDASRVSGTGIGLVRVVRWEPTDEGRRSLVGKEWLVTNGL